MNSNIPQVYWSLGYVHLFRKEYDKAAQAVQRAIEISPNYADAYGLLALIYNHQGNPEGAITNISKAMKLNPYYGIVTWHLLTCHELTRRIAALILQGVIPGTA